MVPQVVTRSQPFKRTEKFYTVKTNFTIGVCVRLPIPAAPSSSSRHYHRWIACVLTLLVMAVACVRAGAEDTQGDLDAVKRQIERTTTELGKAESSRQALEGQLRDNQALIGQLTTQTQVIEDEIGKHQMEVDRLRAERALTQSALNTDKKVLMGQLKVSYSVARQDYIKLLLNQEDPSAVLRGLTYHAIVQRHQNAGLQLLLDEMIRIADEEHAIDREIARLDELHKVQVATRASLDRSREKRESLLAALGLEIEHTATELERLRLDEEKLEKLLSGLKEDLTDISDAGEESAPFVELKGSLPWPARGRVLHGFGTERGANGLSWQGLLIGADQGDAVHAVSHGRVAFAEPLKGFGLLLIVDHGGGYMSLYGRNGRLFKEVGDWVRSGEPIARVGKGSGDQRTGLYFEIRHNGNPTNPVKWCQGASPMAADALVSG